MQLSDLIWQVSPLKISKCITCWNDNDPGCQSFYSLEELWGNKNCADEAVLNHQKTGADKNSWPTNMDVGTNGKD